MEQLSGTESLSPRQCRWQASVCAYLTLSPQTVKFLAADIHKKKKKTTYFTKYLIEAIPVACFSAAAFLIQLFENVFIYGERRTFPSQPTHTFINTPSVITVLCY